MLNIGIKCYNLYIKIKGKSLKKNVLITGCSSGLGLALSKYYLEQGYKVFGISRIKPEINDIDFTFKSCNLSRVDEIKKTLTTFITEVKSFEVVYLNAGMLGEIKTSLEISIDELKEVYELNVYANKELLYILATIEVKTIIAISSGAAVNGSKGWAGYSLSKAGLNMLLNLYSKEMTNTKLLAVAPGVIKTPMTDVIRYEIDDNKFPSAKKLKEGTIQTPEEAAVTMADFVQISSKFQSGSFVDVRDI
jgi:alcohol dehydrogenase/benzil reductase ((S)-benzoin forming)